MVRNVCLTLLLAIAVIAAIRLRPRPPAPPDNRPDAMTLGVYDVGDLLTDEFWGYSQRGDSMSADARLRDLVGLIQDQAGMDNFYVPPVIGPRYPSGNAVIMPFSGKLCVVQTPYGQLQVQALVARLRAAGHAGNQ